MSGPYIDFGPFRHIGSLVADETESAGRVIIARCLERASEGDRRAFEEADLIRQHLGLEWADLIDHRRAA